MRKVSELNKLDLVSIIAQLRCLLLKATEFDLGDYKPLREEIYKVLEETKFEDEFGDDSYVPPTSWQEATQMLKEKLSKEEPQTLRYLKDNRFECSQCGTKSSQTHICGAQKLCSSCAKTYNESTGPKGLQEE